MLSLAAEHQGTRVGFGGMRLLAQPLRLVWQTLKWAPTIVALLSLVITNAELHLRRTLGSSCGTPRGCPSRASQRRSTGPRQSSWYPCCTASPDALLQRRC